MSDIVQQRIDVLNTPSAKERKCFMAINLQEGHCEVETIIDDLIIAEDTAEKLKARAEKAEKNFWFDLANVCIKAVNDLEYQAEIGEELVTIPRHVWDKSMAEIIEPKEAQA